MERKLSLLILFGGASTEHEVSRVSAASVIRNTDSEKYEIRSLSTLPTWKNSIEYGSPITKPWLPE